MSRTAPWLVAIAAVTACGSRSQSGLYKAGDEHDEGAGELAKASIHLVLDGMDDHRRAGGESRSNASYAGATYGGNMYGGGAYGGDPYGGTSYAGWTVPQWNYAAPNRTPDYAVSATLPGAIEGTVTWAGPPPPKLATACGTLDNPSIHIGSDKGVRGALVYIDKVTVGRALPYYGRPSTVGGALAKRGCALVPAAQLVTPLPASVAIHGDATGTRVRVAAGSAAPATYELQDGGLVELEVKPGVTKIDSDDGRLAAAWVVAIKSPYYAITDDAGRFRIDELAPGTYDLTFWQAPLATEGHGGVIAYGAPIVVHRSVRVAAGGAARVAVTLPK